MNVITVNGYEMTTTKTNQIKRTIIMIIGAIVVMIILVYAYMEITTEQPANQHLLEIKKELKVTLPAVAPSFDILVNYKIL